MTFEQCQKNFKKCCKKMKKVIKMLRKYRIKVNNKTQKTLRLKKLPVIYPLLKKKMKKTFKSN